jgi:hypothetical protein
MTVPRHYSPQSSAGITYTIAINLGISFVLLITLLSLRNISIFNVNKKKKLVAEVLSKDDEDIGHVEETYDYLTTRRTSELAKNKFLRFF